MKADNQCNSSVRYRIRCKYTNMRYKLEYWQWRIINIIIVIINDGSYTCTYDNKKNPNQCSLGQSFLFLWHTKSLVSYSLPSLIYCMAVPADNFYSRNWYRHRDSHWYVFHSAFKCQFPGKLKVWNKPLWQEEVNSLITSLTILRFNSLPTQIWLGLISDKTEMKRGSC